MTALDLDGDGKIDPKAQHELNLMTEAMRDCKIKKAGQKEVIIHCGKQYRFFVDFRNTRRGRAPSESQPPAKSASGNES